MLLIITSDKDLAADFLIVELLRRKLPYFRLNSEELTSAECHFRVATDGLCAKLSVGPKDLDLTRVTSVWYRRAIRPLVTSPLKPSERSFVAGEIRHLIEGLVFNTNVTWVNPIESVEIGEHKVYQLRVAHELGFRVPRTLVSRDPRELKQFAIENTFGTICKPIYHGLYCDGRSRYSVYTRRITEESFNDTESIRACPLLVQEEIPRISDVRATFIGSKCFVADVTSDSRVVDWRSPKASAQYAVSSLSEDVIAKCRAMLRKLGLKYGAFDFVRTPSGELFFLEVNPTGEWAWLEDRLGFPMRDALIDVFFRKEDEC